MFVNFSGNQNATSNKDLSREERLRKAILRNRAKRGRREAAQNNVHPASPPPPQFTPREEARVHYPELVSSGQQTYSETKSNWNFSRKRSSEINWKIPKFKCLIFQFQ